MLYSNYRTWELSIRCMKSIAESSSECAYHIYLVDNASPNSKRLILVLKSPFTKSKKKGIK